MSRIGGYRRIINRVNQSLRDSHPIHFLQDIWNRVRAGKTVIRVKRFYYLISTVSFGVQAEIKGRVPFQIKKFSFFREIMPGFGFFIKINGAGKKIIPS